MTVTATFQGKPELLNIFLKYGIFNKKEHLMTDGKLNVLFEVNSEVDTDAMTMCMDNIDVSEMVKTGIALIDIQSN